MNDESVIIGKRNDIVSAAGMAGKCPQNQVTVTFTHTALCRGTGTFIAWQTQGYWANQIFGIARLQM